MSTKPRTLEHFPCMKVRGRRRRRLAMPPWGDFLLAMSNVQAAFNRLSIAIVEVGLGFEASLGPIREMPELPTFEMPEYPPRHPAALAEVDRG